MPPKKSRVAVAKAQKNTKTKKPPTVKKILNELEKLYPGISDNRIMAQLVEKPNLFEHEGFAGGQTEQDKFQATRVQNE